MHEIKRHQPPKGLEGLGDLDCEEGSDIADFCAEDQFLLAFPAEEESEPLPQDGDFWIEPD